MLSLTIVVLVAAAAGFIVWANDKRHTRYGTGLPAGVAVAVGAVSWIIFIAAGFGYQPGLTWIPWVLPMALGTVAAIGTVPLPPGLAAAPQPPGLTTPRPQGGEPGRRIRRQRREP